MNLDIIASKHKFIETWTQTLIYNIIYIHVCLFVGIQYGYKANISKTCLSPHSPPPPPYPQPPHARTTSSFPTD